MDIDAGFLKITWDGEKELKNLLDPTKWGNIVNAVNRDIGQEISLFLDNIITARGASPASYTLNPGQLTVTVIKGLSRASGKQSWWFQQATQPEALMAFITSVDAQKRLQVGKTLSVRFPNGLVPLKALGEQLWWMRQDKDKLMNYGAKGSQGNEIQKTIEKTVDNIIRRNYITLVGKIANQSTI